MGRCVQIEGIEQYLAKLSDLGARDACREIVASVSGRAVDSKEMLAFFAARGW